MILIDKACKYVSLLTTLHTSAHVCVIIQIFLTDFMIFEGNPTLHKVN